MDQIVTNQADAEPIQRISAGVSPQRIATVAAGALGVSRSGYYDWKRRMPSPRAVENTLLDEAIAVAFAESDEIYGAKKEQAELRDPELASHDVRWASVGKNRMARLMRAQGPRGVNRRRGFIVTTERGKGPQERPFPDLVNRRFVDDAPNQLWLADITDVSTQAGLISLAIVLDA